MRITETELQYSDIMWFGVDRNGYLFECTSGGYGNVPEFVCCDSENVDFLESYFLNQLAETTQERLLVPYEANILIEDSISLARRGVYCFDTALGQEDRSLYLKISQPIAPLLFDDLPEEIRKRMASSRVDIDAREDCIHII